MGRQEVQRSSERARATPAASPAPSFSTRRATAGLLVQQKVSERPGAVRQEAGHRPVSHTIAEGSCQRIQEAGPHSAHIQNSHIAAALQQMQVKMDRLQNTMEDMPHKVAEIMKQIWMTKGQDYMKKRIMSVQTANQDTSGACNLQGFRTRPLSGKAAEPSLLRRQLFTEGQVRESQCTQSVITDGQGQQNQCIQSVFIDWENQQQSHAIQTTCIDGQGPEGSLCTQPLFPDGQDPDQSLKLEPFTPETKEQEGNQAPEQVLCYGPGSGQSYELNPECSYGEGLTEPSIAQGSDTLPANKAAVICSLARSCANPERTVCEATPGSAFERPLFIKRIKGETAIKYFQDLGDKTWGSEKALLSVTDPRDLELKPCTSDLEEDVIKEEEWTRKHVGPVSFEEGVQCDRSLKNFGEKPCLISQMVKTLRYHNNSSERESGRACQRLEEDGKTRQVEESSGEVVSDGSERVKEKEPLVREHQEKAAEEIKEKGPPSDDDKDSNEDAWSDGETCTAEKRTEISFAVQQWPGVRGIIKNPCSAVIAQA
ncbi:uncharacterized protein [Ambystoma mexicanum]|uniref:uncharacterized protein isoform X2 n=1 Tax=Ambystoma mexicanum TaxID=8296 RepID=UPI0037E72D2F